jgi:hypothetical protein
MGGYKCFTVLFECFISLSTLSTDSLDIHDELTMPASLTELVCSDPSESPHKMMPLDHSMLLSFWYHYPYLDACLFDTTHTCELYS